MFNVAVSFLVKIPIHYHVVSAPPTLSALTVSSQDGCKLIVLAMSRHIKGADSLEDVKRVLVYYLERLGREEENSKISWVFDCKNAGLKNMELELINFIIFCMEQNYPDILNFIYIYEMPWIMNAAFKVRTEVNLIFY